MPRNGGGMADTGSPPMTPMTPSARPSRASDPLSNSASARPARAGHRPLTAQEREEWRVWLYDMLRKKGWITVLPSGQETRHVGAFGIAARLGETKEQSANLAQQMLRRGSVPEAWRIINMAATLGISPLAIMYRSFQVSFEQLAALLGPAAVTPLTEVEARDGIAWLRAQGSAPAMPRYIYEHLEHRFTEGYRLGLQLREQLALSEAEFEQLRAFLTERGKEQTRRDIVADERPLDAPTEPDPSDAAGFAYPPAPALTSPFAPEAAAEPPAALPAFRRPPADSPVWQEEDDSADDE